MGPDNGQGGARAAAAPSAVVPAMNGRRQERGGPRMVPPVGYPLHLDDVWLAARSVITRSLTLRRARRALADYLGVRRAWLFSSGRAALTVALRTLAGARPVRREVVLPAYTCYSVASAVARCGLTVRLVDLQPGSFELDPSELARVTGPRTLAIVAPHLLGFPLDLRPCRQLAEQQGACLIDDAAQALGARRAGLPCGAGGEIGILSFGRGKPLTTLGGGALLCDRPEMIELLREETKTLASPGRFASTMAAIQASLYSPLLHPRLYWLPARLPFLKIGATEFDLDFAVRRMPAFKFGLLRSTLRRLDVVHERRRQTAERLEQGLAPLPGIECLPTPTDGFTIYLRYPVLLPDAGAVDAAIGALRGAGIAAGRLYPRSLNRVPELAACSPDHGREFPQAEALAARLLTLPTFPHVTDTTVATICAVLGGSLAGVTTESPKESPVEVEAAVVQGEDVADPPEPEGSEPAEQGEA